MLRGGLPIPNEVLDEIFEELSMDGRRRGETLDIREFASLANSMSHRIN
jgi:16S rRNA A1518/A1519 N6-dimethyltransferase RsmA/KsgA/DIM1 with predicted DNA glycosylase/AP lyase activity